jgi:hypothetical protein
MRSLNVSSDGAASACDFSARVHSFKLDRTGCGHASALKHVLYVRMRRAVACKDASTAPGHASSAWLCATLYTQRQRAAGCRCFSICTTWTLHSMWGGKRGPSGE